MIFLTVQDRAINSVCTYLPSNLKGCLNLLENQHRKLHE